MTYDRAIDIGGTEWKKGNLHRIYFNDEAYRQVVKDEMGLVYTQYKTGNIKSATLNGEPISNGKARKMLPYKIYFDVADGKMVFQTL